ncbi:MAG TPA: nucleotidyltransferase family protein [Nitrospirota bacterium]|nr:nucleotidyltransferase family protein [Nitrospirota bacterium]
MKEWKKVLVPVSSSIRKTIETIDLGALQIAVAVDENGRLVGTVTDGDIRRGLLRGLSLDDTVEKIMNAHPTTVRSHENRETVLALMKSKSFHQIPIVDEEGRVVGIEILDELIRGKQPDNVVVIMAGGVGSRLRPLTDDCPKPLLKVGSKPILEIILENFIDQGFRKFYISVNYKAEMIEEYFGDGSRWGVGLTYLREKAPLGTAGALTLLADELKKPVIIMNGDLLTRLNFHQLLDFHKEHNAKATMCVRDYDYQVPYGVVTIDKHRLAGIEEKPIHHFFVSAGIYVFDPEVVALVPKNRYFDMPDLFQELIRQNKETAVFPIREYWIDIGRIDDFEKANGEYNRNF